jgi:NAD(P)H-dependent FMN reductase
MAAADGVVLISPTYHGALSGVLKNALDYLNDLAGAGQPYLSGRPIGCVALAQGGQGAASTLATLRIVGHALRGWPTPLGVALAGDEAALSAAGEPAQPRAREQLGTMLAQVLSLAGRNAAARPDPATDHDSTEHDPAARRTGVLAAAGAVDSP